MSNRITISATVQADIDKVWNAWTSPEHVVKWNAASDDWHCPKAENDARTGGEFSFTMASRDGKMSFDFGGVYDEVIDRRKIAYTMGDGRKAVVDFENLGNQTKVTESFDQENQNPLEMQRGGWQAILDNFKKHVEAL